MGKSEVRMQYLKKLSAGSLGVELGVGRIQGGDCKVLPEGTIWSMTKRHYLTIKGKDGPIREPMLSHCMTSVSLSFDWILQ